MKTFFVALPDEWERRLEKALARRGHSPVVLKDFDSAGEILREEGPTIIVLHDGGPNGSALSFCRKLREVRPSAKLKILLCVSAVPEKESWPPYQRAEVAFVLPAAFGDFEVELRVAACECLLTAGENEALACNPDIDFASDTENVPYGEFYSTLDGKLLKANMGLANILGYSSKEELLRADLDRDVYFDPGQRSWLVATVPSQNISFEVVWKRRDGTPITVQLAGHVIHDEAHRAIFFKGIVWDHTEHLRNREMLLMQRDLGIALSRVGTLGEMLDIVLDTAVRIEGVDCAGFYLVEEGTRIYRMAASRGLSPEGAKIASVATPEMPQVERSEKGDPIYVRTEELDPAAAEWCRSEGIRFLSCVPIAHNGRVIATLNVASRAREEFSRSARLAVETIAMQIGGCLSRVQAVESLHAGRANLQMLFDAVDDMVMVVNAEGKILHHNLAAEKKLGYSRGELREKPILDLHPADRKEEARDSLARILDGRQSFCRVPMETKSGKLLPVESRVVLGEWEGQAVGFGVARDLSEREASRKALAESENRYRLIAENASDVVWSARWTPPDLSEGIPAAADSRTLLENLLKNWRFEYFSPSLEKVLGYSFEDAASETPVSRIAPECHADLAKIIVDNLFDQPPSHIYEFPLIAKGGSTVWCEVTVNFIATEPGEPLYMMGILRDITARHEAEEALQKSEARYRLIAENVDDVVWSAHWTPPDFSKGGMMESFVEIALSGWKFEYVSPSVERLFGFTVEDCMADLPEYRKVPDSFPAAAQKVIRNLTAHYAGDTFRQTFEVPLYAKDGTQRWCEITVAFLPTEPGAPLHLTGILRDITSRHEAEESLRISEAKLRGLFENLPDFVILVDRDATIRFVNHGAPGVSAEALIGGRGFDFLQASDRPRCREAFEAASNGGEARSVEARDVFGNYWACRIVPIVMEDGLDLIMIICTDVTEQKKAGMAVIEEQKLLRQLIDLQERERRYLAYEIHDGFAQQITGALFHLEAFERLREEDGELAERNLVQAGTMLRRSIGETRRLISGLRPPILDESGILAALDYLVCEQRERSGIDIMFVHNLRATRLAPPLECAVFRIVQESLTNAARHSQSDFIRVELNDLEDRLEVVVFDEGVGFDPSAVPDDRFGLRSIREHSRLLGGMAEIRTQPGEGCRICVELPLVGAAGG